MIFSKVFALVCLLLDLSQAHDHHHRGLRKKSPHAHVHEDHEHNHDHHDHRETRSADGTVGHHCGAHDPTPEEIDLNNEITHAYRAAHQGDGRRLQQVVTVPTWVHVLYNSNNEGRLTQGQVDASMNELNKAFLPMNFVFDLIQTDYVQDNSAFTDQNGEGRFKPTYHKNGMETLNIYFNSGGGYLGYATFPTSNQNFFDEDGVVVAYNSVPGSPGPYGEGDTLTHEVGHWLGLYHTFQGGCSGAGDSIADTPAQASPTQGCPNQAPDSCPGGGADPINNFMDYSYDECLDEFTSDQKDRMHANWDQYRAATLPTTTATTATTPTTTTNSPPTTTTSSSSTTTSSTTSNPPGTCVSVADFLDSYDDDCDDYALPDNDWWCDGCADYGSNIPGLTACSACCACGGGNIEATTTTQATTTTTTTIPTTTTTSTTTTTTTTPTTTTTTTTPTTTTTTTTPTTTTTTTTPTTTTTTTTPTTTTTTPESETCQDLPGFQDSYGDGCGWYKKNGCNGCEAWANWKGETACDSCCVCEEDKNDGGDDGGCSNNENFRDFFGDDCSWYENNQWGCDYCYDWAGNGNACSSCCVCQ